MEKIEEILKGIRPEFEFASDTDLISGGVLDSFDIITLVSELDSQFGISIVGTDILPDNLRSIAAITVLLEKYGVKQ